MLSHDLLTKEYEEYFKQLEKKFYEAYKIAQEARKKGLDPKPFVEIEVANDMADRVVGIISLVAPILKELPFNVAQRIRELEKEYSALDWRVALKIGEEVAKAIFEKTHDKRYAIEVGLRVAEAYVTMGTVAAPIEGIAKVEIKKRRDGKEYLAIYTAGPIRAAGGTAAALIALFGDYLRKVFGLDKWDPTPEEIERYIIEIYDYDRIKRLQYRPTREELEFLLKNLPVEIDGEPTEDKEVSAYKDLPRIKTNRIRGGVALTIAEGLCQKAKKIWKKLKKWGKEWNLDDWSWLEKFLEIQEAAKSKSSEEEKKEEDPVKAKIKPNWKYLSELAAGRPVFSLPMAKGGFRLRYGKSRTNGLESSCIHPAASYLLNEFPAIALQFRPERPGKSTAISYSDTIEPPVVKLKDGSVVRVKTVKQAKELKGKIAEILFLGDILINFGNFYHDGVPLPPAGYCEEWWVQEFERAAEKRIQGFKVHFDMKKPRELFEIEGIDKLAEFLEIDAKRLEELIRYPLKKKPKFSEALKISLLLDIPLHPKYTYFWKDLSPEQIAYIAESIKNAKIEYGKEIEINGKKIKLIKRIIIENIDPKAKRALEEALVIHKVENGKVIIEHPDASALAVQLGFLISGKLDLEKIKEIAKNAKNGLEVIEKIAEVKIRDKVGTYIGARMGRPEKAKMRKMKGRPHMLFPVGQEGGRMRNFMEAVKQGKITAEFTLRYCEKCKKYTLYPKCEFCGSETIQLYKCPKCSRITKLQKCPECDVPTKPYTLRIINPKEYLELALKNLKIFPSEVPQIVKGVKGLTNKTKIPERLEKGILRAKYGLHVFRDGTIRFDSVELPIVYFRPKDLLYVSIEKLKELGYTHDIFGRPLESEDQILELKPQDVILPAGGENFAKLLVKVAQFVDEELQRLYGLKPYYNVKSPEDLVGHLGIAIAPHTSAGVLVRIIGFSKTQAYFAHPLLHAGCRRNCFSKSTYVYLIKDGKLIFKPIGEIVEEILKEGKYDDIEPAGDSLIIYPKEKYYVISYDPYFDKIELKEVKMFIKRKQNSYVKIKTASGKEIILTEDHPVTVQRNGKITITLAKDLKEGDYIPTIKKLCVRFSEPLEEIDVYELLKDELELKTDGKYVWLVTSHKVPRKIRIDEDLMWLFGLYTAEGFIHENEKTWQVCFRNFDEKIVEKLKKVVKEKFNIDIVSDEEGRWIIASKIITKLFEKLGFGRKLEEKDIPDWIFNLDEGKIAAFIAGLIDGDGSIITTKPKIYYYSANFRLINKVSLLLAKLGIFVRWKIDKNRFGKTILERYKDRNPPESAVYRLDITSIDRKILVEKIKEFLASKKEKAEEIAKRPTRKRYSLFNGKRYEIIENNYAFWEPIMKVEFIEKDDYAYSLEVDGHGTDKTVLVQYGIFLHQCDGDELCFILLMDALLNFSREYLPEKRGGRMDAPLVITLRLKAHEVDDEVHDYDTVWNYPLEFYEETLKAADPAEVKEKLGIENLGDRLFKPEQYFNYGFMHDWKSINYGNKISAYKKLKTMMEKINAMIKLAEITRASDASVVAELVIEGHLARDVKGNLRRFSDQKFRCVKCNEKFRRVPLTGKCPKCGGRIVFTVPEGAVRKYLEICVFLAEKYVKDQYIKQNVLLLKQRVEQTFAKAPKKQTTLDKWFSS